MRVMQKCLPTYLLTVCKVFKYLQEHLEAQNLEKVSAAIHKLKGAIVMLQYPPLSELIVTTENTFNQQQDTLIVEQLITELRDVIDKIKLWL